MVIIDRIYSFTTDIAASDKASSSDEESAIKTTCKIKTRRSTGNLVEERVATVDSAYHSGDN